MIRELEALLFATDAPLTMARLRAIFKDKSTQEIRDSVEALNNEYTEQDHAFSIVEFGGGWQISSRAEYAPVIEKLFKGRRYTRLSRAALEVLAVTAYRQPVTRLEIEDIRGVQCGGVLSTLLERGLISVAGRAETVGHPLLYGTTREFLSHLGLKSVKQLPELPDVGNLLDDRDGLKAFAKSIGSNISDNELDEYGSSPDEENEQDTLELVDEDTVLSIEASDDPPGADTEEPRRSNDEISPE